VELEFRKNKLIKCSNDFIEWKELVEEATKEEKEVDAEWWWWRSGMVVVVEEKVDAEEARDAEEEPSRVS